ncbi:hypothetical protein P863_13005, partial [Mycobacterium avium subsp. silvaticum ATCC 49884]
ASELSAAPGATIAMPRLLTRAQDVSPGDRSVLRRMLARMHSAWESGASWVAWVIGVISVPVDGVLFIVAIIAASGASVTAQVSASVAFVVLMYAVVEVILVGYLATPGKTQSLLLVLHDWVRTYHRQILVALFTVVGVSQLAQGLHLV